MNNLAVSIIILLAFDRMQPSTADSSEENEELMVSESRGKITADIVLAIDTASYGWGDRTEADVFVDGLRPFLKEFAECLWNAAKQIRVAVVEMAKDSNILVDLVEGKYPSAVATAFDRKDRRLNDTERKSTTHIYRMLNLVNSTVCNRSSDNATRATIPCVVIVITVAPAPVLVSFVGADWPSWRSLGDAVIQSAFDLGVDIVVLTTGYHQPFGSKRAGLSEMARVEGRFAKHVPSSEHGAEARGAEVWKLTYWQAGYDPAKNVDRRVATKTVLTLHRVLALSEAEKVVPKEPGPAVPPKLHDYDEAKVSDEMIYVRSVLLYSLFGTLLGFLAKTAVRFWWGDADKLIPRFILALIVNLSIVSILMMAHRYFDFAVFFKFDEE